MRHRYLQATTAATFLLLIAGGLVTSTDSGLAVPDWPLSYGTLFPPMVGGIRYEHGHRLLAGAVGLLILILAVWVGRTEPRRWVRRLAYAALIGVVLQALLGGLTVLLLLPPAVSIAHACLGPSVFCLLVCLACAASPSWIAAPVRREEAGRPAVAALSRAVAASAAGQLLLGAVLRHTGRGLAAHLAGAVLLAFGAGWLLARTRGAGAPPAVRAMARRLAGLVAAQWGLGLASLWRREDVLLVTAHVGVGALVLAQAVVLAWQARRLFAPAGRAGGRAWRQQAADYAALTKPRVTALVVLTTLAGFWLGLEAGGPAAALWPTLLGTALAAGGANALNQWLERGPDALMIRTRGRPVPAGRLSPAAARGFGLLLVGCGILLLFLTAHAWAAALAALTVATYVGLYTPLKRMTSLCTLVGAVPGALPPVIGWAAARGTLGPEAWVLFAVLFLWQLPHFLAIAMLYRDEYARAGFRLLPLAVAGEERTARHMLLYGLVLVPVSLSPTLFGMAGSGYFYGALALSLAFLLSSARAAHVPSPVRCRQLFRASIAYLPLILALLAADKTAAAPRSPAALPRLAEVPAFRLTDQRTRAVTRESLRGRVWVADFIFTTCPGQCPLLTERLTLLQRAFAGEPRLAFVSISVDPVRDTPAVLAAYAARHGADARWVLLTGEPEAVAGLCREGFGLALGAAAPGAREGIAHSRRLVLVDAAGAVRGYYDASEGAAMGRLRRDIAQLLEGGG
jgi:protoheme IX farnesyltransferase